MVIHLKRNWKTLMISIAIPLLVGGVSGFISRGGMELFKQLNKPPFSPPGWIFPVVWTVLFILIGIASYLIFISDQQKSQVQKVLRIYAIQLAINFFWPIFFFYFQWYLFSFLWLLFLWFFILLTIISFSKISKTAAYLLVPYLLWVTFAGYLNLFIFILN